MVAHTALGCASSDAGNKVQQERGEKEGRRHSPWVDGGVIAGSVQGIRDDEVEVRGVEVPALLLLPPRRHSGASSSNGSRRADGDTPLGPASFSSPHALPLFFLRRRTG
jgi:hypothetical protein